MVKDSIAVVGGLVLALCLLVGLVIGGNHLRLYVMRTFGTEYENVRTDIYRNNKSYVEGTIRDLRELRREYLAADDEHKDAVKSLILHRAGELDYDRLPSDLRSFLKEIDQ